MELRQLEYILMIDQEKNISHAAEKLYISQSALNQQLLKLEKELGTQLFVRSRRDWHATEAGKIYLEGAREILNIRKDTYARIHDVLHSEKATLAVGLAHGRGFDMFMAIYPALHEQFPNLSLVPTEMSTRRQIENVRNGSLDLGFLTLTDIDRTDDDFIELGREELMLLLPVDHPLANADPAKEVDLRDFTDDKIAMPGRNTKTRALAERVFENEGIVPNTMFESNDVMSIVSMVQLGFCCGIVPAYYLTKVFTDDIRAFHLPHRPAFDLCIMSRKKSYMSDGARTFIELAKNFWAENLPPL